MSSYIMCREMLNDYTISDESLNALMGNWHGENGSIGEKVKIKMKKTDVNLRSCIINYSQGLIHQLSSCSDSSSPSFHGIVIKTEEYISCIPRLMDFIKSHAVTSGESSALLSQYLDKKNAINDHTDIVDTLHSPLPSPQGTGSPQDTHQKSMYPELSPSPPPSPQGTGSQDTHQRSMYLELLPSRLPSLQGTGSPQDTHQKSMYPDPEQAESNTDFNPPLSPIRSWPSMEKVDLNERDISCADCPLAMSHSQKDLDLSTSFLNMSIIDDTKEDSILLHVEAISEKEATSKETSDVNDSVATQDINKETCPKVLSITSKPVSSLDFSEKCGSFNIQNDESGNEIPSHIEKFKFKTDTPEEFECDFNKQLDKASFAFLPKLEQDGNETDGTCVSDILDYELAFAELDEKESKILNIGEISDSRKKELPPEIHSQNAAQELSYSKETGEKDLSETTKYVTDTKEVKDNNCLAIPTDKCESLVEKKVLCVLSKLEKSLRTPEELEPDSNTIHSADLKKTDTKEIKNNNCLPISSNKCPKRVPLVVKKALVSGASKPEKPVQTPQELNSFSGPIHGEEQKKTDAIEVKENNCLIIPSGKCTKRESIEWKEVKSDLTKTEKPLSTPQELKSYLKPFHSEDQKENEDINDPNWGVIRNLETDEDRYKMIRKLWKSSMVPDPNEDLTHYGYRNRRWANGTPQKRTSLQFSQKRARELDDYSVLPIGKRPRRFEDLSFNHRAIDTTLNLLTQDYERRTEMCFNCFDRRKIDNRYCEYVNQLRNARKEAEIIHKFYQGLPNQTHMAQKEIEEEQWDIEQVYNLFKRHYRWSGQVFNPIVNKR